MTTGRKAGKKRAISLGYLAYDGGKFLPLGPTEPEATELAVRRRSQLRNPRTHTWTKRDKKTGRFMAVKSGKTPHKGIRKEK